MIGWSVNLGKVSFQMVTEIKYNIFELACYIYIYIYIHTPSIYLHIFLFIPKNHRPIQISIHPSNHPPTHPYTIILSWLFTTNLVIQICHVIIIGQSFSVMLL